jgi:sulfofructose kinase
MFSADRAGGARVVCAGIAVLDQVFHVDQFPPAGAKTRATQLHSVAGGCAANAAIACARLGGQAALIAPLGGPPGTDATGDAILAALAGEGIDCSGVIRMNEVRSPLSAIVVDASGERTIINHRDHRLSQARVPDPAAALSDAAALLVDNRFPELVMPLCLAAREYGIPVVLDADKPTRLTNELLAICTHIVFPADGLRATAQHDDLTQGLRAVSAMSKAFLAVTDGAHGVLWIADSQVHHLPAINVPAVDTLGAGDVFHGVFVLAAAEGMALEAGLRFANVAAGLKCARPGGGAGAPNRQEVMQALARLGA